LCSSAHENFSDQKKIVEIDVTGVDRELVNYPTLRAWPTVLSS
jgi:hypothetical protein